MHTVQDIIEILLNTSISLNPCISIWFDFFNNVTGYGWLYAMMLFTNVPTVFFLALMIR
jgi:hypothetical protein